MSQSAPAAGGDKPGFGGFFQVYLLAVVILMIYYTIDFQVSVSPSLKGLKPDSATSRVKRVTQAPVKTEPKNVAQPETASTAAPPSDTGSRANVPPRVDATAPVELMPSKPSGVIPEDGVDESASYSFQPAVAPEPENEPQVSPAVATGLETVASVTEPTLAPVEPAGGIASVTEPANSTGTPEVGQ